MTLEYALAELIRRPEYRGAVAWRKPSFEPVRVTERTYPAAQIEAGRCWWCGSESNSREHKFKRTDLQREWDRAQTEGGAVYSVGDESQRIRGPKSALVKFKPTLCTRCNNERSQAFDRAYDQLTDWIADNEELMLERRELDFRLIYGSEWQAGARNAGRYFVKHGGCVLAECLQAGSVWIGTDVLDYLNGSPQWPASLAMELYIDLDRLLVSDCFEAHEGARTFLSTSDVDTALHVPTGELVGPQSRLCWRGFAVAWQFNGLDPRPDPFAGPALSLPAISSAPPQLRERAVASFVATGAPVVGRRRSQGLI